MNLESLITEQIKQTLDINTKNVIDSISEQFNINKEKLISIWNSLNQDFKINLPCKVELLDEEIGCEVNECVVEILDEDF